MRSSSPSCLASRMKRGRNPGDQFTRLRASPVSGDPRSDGSENERVTCCGVWPSDSAGVMMHRSWRDAARHWGSWAAGPGTRGKASREPWKAPEACNHPEAAAGGAL